MALQRLSAPWSTREPSRKGHDTHETVKGTKITELAFVQGRTDAPLWIRKLGDLIDQQAEQYGSKTAAVFPWQCHTLSYHQLAERSKVLARAMLQMGLHHGDCVGILAGNCYQYLEVFLGGARIGCPVVVLNTTYTPTELNNALTQSSCKLLFISPNVGPRSFAKHIDLVSGSGCTPLALRRIVHLGEVAVSSKALDSQIYNDFVSSAHSGPVFEADLKLAETSTHPTDVLNLQFTSGTTGAPKAAMLTHINLLNNARFVGDSMRLTVDDVLCCPPPLFHCFGLVMGFLASVCHGSSIIFPSPSFEVNPVLDAMVNATALLGVPTMFVALLEENDKKNYTFTKLRTGLAAGAAVPAPLMDRLREKLGVEAMLIAYGMTETSPVTFMASLDDSQERRAKTLGRVMPHTVAKVVSKDGKGTIVKRGETGELCVSGYALQKGYWKNEGKTAEVMKADEHGTLWMHTGDECKIDEEDYCWITGRIKDVIIRGGENIFPVEIEERLLAHPAISEASVVGLNDSRYGEVVTCFLRSAENASRPDDAALRVWVRERLGRHKAPKYVFWIGDVGVGNDFPKTGSGKHQKHILRDIGNALVKEKVPRAKL